MREWIRKIRFAFISWLGHRRRTFSVNPELLKKGPVQYEKLSEELEKRIRDCFARLAEVDKTPVENLLDDFKRDQNPEREIAVWEAVADAYEAFLKTRKTDPAIRQAAFQVLMQLSMSGGKSLEVKDLRRDPLTDADIEKLKSLFL
jgi:hypothetical protein